MSGLVIIYCFPQVVVVVVVVCVLVVCVFAVFGGSRGRFRVTFLLPVPVDAQPWTKNFSTRNWVQWQRTRVGEPDRSNPAEPNMCLVVSPPSFLS